MKYDYHLLETYRDLFTKQTTLGTLHVVEEGKDAYKFSEILEDTVRPDGIKVKAHTAIPAELLLNCDIRFSPKFQRDCVVLYTHKEVKNGVTRYYIRHKGIEFGEVMYHGGNDHGDTEGCPLTAKNRTSDHNIQGTKEKELTALVKKLMETCDVKAIFHNGTQTN